LSIETLLLALARIGDLRDQVPAAVALLLTINIFYLVSVWLVLKIRFDDKSPGISGLAWISGAAALLFRLTCLPAPPSLSDDIFRYRWEGRLQTVGGNPYLVRPNDPNWKHLDDEVSHRIPGRDFPSVYGPVLLLVEQAAWRIVSRFSSEPSGQILGFKLVNALFELGLIAALVVLLRAKRMPVERVLVYAWSPLPIVEFWGSGHNDSITLLFTVLALAAAARRRWVWAFLSLALAAATKYWPLALFPLFIGWGGRRALRPWQWWVALPLWAGLFLPYWANVEQNVRFTSGFLGGWRNNDSLFGVLLLLAGDLYLAKYLAFGVVAAGVLAIAWRRWQLERACLWTIALILMVSSNCHPWYLTWLLPLLVMCPSVPLLLWTALAPLAYRVLIDYRLLGQWQGSTPERWWIYLPVYAMLAVGSARALYVKTGRTTFPWTSVSRK